MLFGCNLFYLHFFYELVLRLILKIGNLSEDIMKKKEVSPFQLLSQTEVYSNPWISVKEDRCIGLDGKDCLYGVTTVIDGIAVLALDDRDNAVLVREYKYAIQKRSIEVVCGGIEKSDTSALETAKRELKEELGIEAASFTYVGVTDPFTSVIYSKVHLFIAEDLTYGDHQREVNEAIELERIPLSEAYAMIDRGEITHAPTIILLQRVQLNKLKNKLDSLNLQS